jgi:small-conductance mechanosensitive channel
MLAFLFGLALLGDRDVDSKAFGQLPLPKPAASANNRTSQSGPQSEAQAPAAEIQSIETKLAEVRARIAATEELGDTAITNAPPGVAPQDLTVRRALLHRLARLLEQQLSNVAALEAAKSRREEASRAAQAWTRFAEPPPYSILRTDRLREEIQAERFKGTSGEAALSTIDQLIAENQDTLNQAEGRIRQLNERLEGAKDPAASARLSWQRELERLQSQVAAASLGILDSERRLRQEGMAESRTRLGVLERQLLIADAGSKFTQTDLDKVMAQIESDRQNLERQLTEAQSQLQKAKQALEAAREELSRIPTDSDASRVARARAAEAVSAREARLETANAAIRAFRVMLESESVERTMWELRFAAYDSRSVEALSDSARRLATFTRRLDLWKDYQQQELELVRNQLELQETRIRSLPPDSDLLPPASERLAALREREQLVMRIVRRMEQVQLLSQRWAEGLKDAEGHLPFFGRVQNVFSDAGSFFKKLWTFELFTAEDTITVEGQKITGKRSITLGKIVMAVLILGVGIWITGLISNVTEPIIIRRLKIEANQARLIRRWIRAFMVVCLVMFSLLSVKIPLTVFAFAGGALAIGLGFGMQTLLKNFVSGLILLFERPFRVGDVLEVGNQRGTVTEIGLRSSVLQLWDGTETLIPNSSLLENNVSNWTYSNRKVRFSVTVGSAYGSDPRRVLQLLTEAVERHGVVEKEPKPQALFTDFGDSALTFELRYWVDVIKANAAQVGSDLRQMIAGSFAENGIVIAFPQRDLHLDTARPLQVQITPNSVATPRVTKAANQDLPDNETKQAQAKNAELQKSLASIPKIP